MWALDDGIQRLDQPIHVVDVHEPRSGGQISRIMAMSEAMIGKPKAARLGRRQTEAFISRQKNQSICVSHEPVEFTVGNVS